ncbi:hypothetical protein FB45DRAFT_862583 [Roridomyces roridus]|uniref:Uncharacterized protein n=1 Tax=Roridomyces roridus TaxID=1738132 RepID=A0AAD7FT12_9AGAR|nr:hypothetical protein FB45DRAFT_862583 [Roridomyces roridus]
MDNESPTASRTTARGDETPTQRLKREKAAERQRKKRVRDRASLPTSMSFPPVPQPDGSYPQPDGSYQPEYTPAPAPHPDANMTPEELARREKVRAAARERQRKHRQLVKARKMRELGMDMGNEIMPGMEEVHYRVNADGHYEQVLAQDLHAVQAVQAAQVAHVHALQQQAQAQGDAQFPQSGGLTFATTILLSLSGSPLLKQHLLRSLNMTNDELASLEPAIAETWERWDQARRMRYEHPEGFPPSGAPPIPPGGPAYTPPYPLPPAAEDFRGRFQRVMSVPAPFRTLGEGFSVEFGGASNGTAENGAEDTASSGGSVTAGGGTEAIDPHLTKDDDGVKAES